MRESLRQEILGLSPANEALSLCRLALSDPESRISPGALVFKNDFDRIYDLRGKNLRQKGAKLFGWDDLLERVRYSNEQRVWVCLIKCRGLRIIVVADAAGSVFIGCAAFQVPEASL